MVESPARKVWITRAEPGAARTAEAVAALGLQPLAAPLLTVQPTGAALGLQPFEALAVTSAQAIAALGPDVPRAAPVFAVGDATAEAAKAAGFTAVISADGDVEALTDLILRARPRAVVHAAATETAGDLVGRLVQAGMAARRVEVYRATPRETLPAEVAEAFAAGRIAAIVVHSPRAGALAATLTARAGIDPGSAPVFGLSPACAQPLAERGFAVQTAAAPKEAALMARLAEWAATI